jgi:hypothetical protein
MAASSDLAAAQAMLGGVAAGAGASAALPVMQTTERVLGARAGLRVPPLAAAAPGSPPPPPRSAWLASAHRLLPLAAPQILGS